MTTAYNPRADWAREDRTDLLATLTRDGGFTYDPRTGRLVTVGSTTGYAIALPGTEHTITPITLTGFYQAMGELLTTYAPLADDEFIGGWYSDERDAYMIELTGVYRIPRESAVRLGQLRDQEGILDMATGEFIATAPVAVPVG